MWLIKLTMFLWPFVKEIILGDKTLKEAAKHHKKKLVLIFIIFLSIWINFFTIAKIFSVPKEKSTTSAKLDRDSDNVTDKEIKEILETPDKPKVPEVKNADIHGPIKKPVSNNRHFDAIKNEFELIEKEELRNKV